MCRQQPWMMLLRILSSSTSANMYPARRRIGKNFEMVALKESTRFVYGRCLRGVPARVLCSRGGWRARGICLWQLCVPAAAAGRRHCSWRCASKRNLGRRFTMARTAFHCCKTTANAARSCGSVANEGPMELVGIQSKEALQARTGMNFNQTNVLLLRGDSIHYRSGSLAVARQAQAQALGQRLAMRHGQLTLLKTAAPRPGLAGLCYQDLHPHASPRHSLPRRPHQHHPPCLPLCSVAVPWVPH